MNELYLLIIVSIGILIYIKDKGFVPCYWLLVQTLCLPIHAFANNILMLEDVFSVIRQANTVLSMLLLVLLVFKWKKVKRKIRVFGNVFGVLLGLFLFGLCWTFYHGATSMYYGNTRNLIMLSLFPIYIWIVGGPSIKQLIATILIIVFVEIVLAFANHYLGFHLYICHYFSLNERGSDEFTSGTFYRFNALAAFLVTFQSIISCEFLIRRRINSRFFLVLSIIIGVVVLMTGSRLALLIYIVSMAVPIIKNLRQNKLYFIIGIGAFVLMVVAILSIDLTSTREEEMSGVERNLIGLGRKFYDNEDTQYMAGTEAKSTDDLSRILIEEYFDFNPLGQGLSATKEPEDAYGHYAYVTDCQYAFDLVERGWMYSLLFFLFFLFHLKISKKYICKKDRFSLNFVFMLLLLQGITDSGITDPLLFSMFILYAYYCKFKYKTATTIKRVKRPLKVIEMKHEIGDINNHSNIQRIGNS